MKLAEALVLRADCQRKIAQLRQRLERVVKVQEGEEPAEDPNLLIQELEHTVSELTKLVVRINKTNALTSFEGNQTIADVLSERDSIMQRRKLLDEILENSTIRQDRFSRSEVKFYRTIDVKAIQQRIDDLSKQYRELDFKIQQKNWTIDLIE
ncbi:hypothetical protein D3C81_1088680 [compost metagenome]